MQKYKYGNEQIGYGVVNMGQTYVLTRQRKSIERVNAWFIECKRLNKVFIKVRNGSKYCVVTYDTQTTNIRLSEEGKIELKKIIIDAVNKSKFKAKGLSVGSEYGHIDAVPISCLESCTTFLMDFFNNTKLTIPY